MIITPSPEIVRLPVMMVNAYTNNIKHDYDIEKLYENINKYKYELVFYSNSEFTNPKYGNEYYFDVGSNLALVFAPVTVGQSKMLVRLNKNKTVTYASYSMPYSDVLFIQQQAKNQYNSEMSDNGLTRNTYTVGYSSGRLVVDFTADAENEMNGSYLFAVWAVGDTTGNAEQVFCTKVPSKNFVAKSTPSLFTVTQDSVDTNIYYIACKTSGYTTTLNVTKIIDTTTEAFGYSGVTLYMEESGGGE